jgi:hypothetical protein
MVTLKHLQCQNFQAETIIELNNDIFALNFKTKAFLQNNIFGIINNKTKLNQFEVCVMVNLFLTLS